MPVAPEYIQHRGQFVPLWTKEAANFSADDNKLSQAIKHEKKQRHRCELKFTDPAKFKKQCKTYLSSRRCLIAALWKTNRGQPIKKRLSVGQIIEVSAEYKGLRKLDEDVVVRIVPKKSGYGTRPIKDFGPVARAAQNMVALLLRQTYTQKGFQYPGKTAPQKIELAINLLTEKGYEHVAEIDIIAYYPSFEAKKLEEHLNLPKEAVREIVMAKSANLVNPSGSPFIQHTYPKARSGIPQGSASSSEVALENVAQLKMAAVKDVVLINHADNFFLFAATSKDLEIALKALSLGISKLPGGSFIGEIVNSGPATEGFRMLGCRLHRQDGEITVVPTETNMQYLGGRFEIDKQKTKAMLNSARMAGDELLRLEAVEEFLKLRNFVDGWATAFSLCGDMVEIIHNDLMYDVHRLQLAFDITDAELKTAKLCIGKSNYDIFWNLSGHK
jgi:hypothetical protein